MERQRARIRAESDLREVNVGVALSGQEAMESTTETLVLELGEISQIRRSSIVKGDPNRKAKFASVMRR
jgi:hypothetical protein